MKPVFGCFDKLSMPYGLPSVPSGAFGTLSLSKGAGRSPTFLARRFASLRVAEQEGLS